VRAEVQRRECDVSGSHEYETTDGGCHCVRCCQKPWEAQLEEGKRRSCSLASVNVMLTWFKTDLLERVKDKLRKKYRATNMIFVRGEVRCSGAGSGCVCASSSRASCSRPSADSEVEDEGEDDDDEEEDSRLCFSSRLSRDERPGSVEIIVCWSWLYRCNCIAGVFCMMWCSD